MSTAGSTGAAGGSACTNRSLRASQSVSAHTTCAGSRRQYSGCARTIDVDAGMHQRAGRQSSQRNRLRAPGEGVVFARRRRVAPAAPHRDAGLHRAVEHPVQRDVRQRRARPWPACDVSMRAPEPDFLNVFRRRDQVTGERNMPAVDRDRVPARDDVGQWFARRLPTRHRRPCPRAPKTVREHRFRGARPVVPPATGRAASPAECDVCVAGHRWPAHSPSGRAARRRCRAAGSGRAAQ